MSGNDWLQPGVEFYVLSGSYGRASGTLEKRTVARVGKRDMFDDKGDRWNISGQLLYPVKDMWSNRYTQLLHPDDPKIAEVRDANRRADAKNRAVSAADAALKHLRDGKTSDALLALKEAVEQLEAIQ